MVGRNVLANPRCAIQIHAPGWTGLNNARVTLFGDVYPVTEESKKDANELFASKRRRMKPRTEQTNEKRSPQDSSTIPLANTRYFVMGKIVDVLFVGGYGTVTWITPEQYAAAGPTSSCRWVGFHPLACPLPPPPPPPFPG